MKKYKLIGTYPRSPKLGTIVDSDGIIGLKKEGIEKLIFDRSRRLSNAQMIFLGDKRFWEEVIEKDFEVLSFASNSLGDLIIYNRKKDGLFYSEVSLGYKESFFYKKEVKTNGFKIHSVKRLSDGEVFTLKDNIKVPKDDKILKIEEITLNEKELKVYYMANSCVTNQNSNWFEKIQKAKPVFISEDGVDIYKGDNYVKVSSNFLLTVGWQANTIETFNQHRPGANFFSSEEAAKEFIYSNKPLLMSAEDVLEIYRKTRFSVHSFETNLLRKIEKEC